MMVPTWTTVSTITGYDSQGAYNMTLAVSPLAKNLILARGVEGWRIILSYRFRGVL